MLRLGMLIGCTQTYERHTNTLVMSASRYEALGTGIGETHALRLVCCSTRPAFRSRFGHPIHYSKVCSFFVAAGCERYKRAKDEAQCLLRASSFLSSPLLCDSQLTGMAFKALLSIVAIVAAIQGASGTFDDSMCTMTP